MQATLKQATLERCPRGWYVAIGGKPVGFGSFKTATIIYYFPTRAAAYREAVDSGINPANGLRVAGDNNG